ncbi:hypothetical protein SAMN05443247_08765 [Bradyrhizobium erythrophlei]|nr:hypothetical protein SAMN05443247_08765 [Bradyrhizobium erythrophlei]
MPHGETSRRAGCLNRARPVRDALIGSFECTFCTECSTTKLGERCPNCGGAFQVRPIRPADKLGKFPASTRRVFKPEGCAS